MSMRLSFCVKAATTLDADDLDTLTTGIEGYVKTGVDERQAEKMALDDLIAEVAKERAAIVSLAREQYPELFAGVAAERVGPVEAPAAESATPEPAPAEAPGWHTLLPDQGEPSTQQDRTHLTNPKAPIDARKVSARLAAEAFEAITPAQRTNLAVSGMALYPWVLPAQGRRNGVVRLLPEDQKPGAPWQQVGTEPVNAGGVRNLAINDLTSRLGRAPIIGDETAAAETAAPAAVEAPKAEAKAAPDIAPMPPVAGIPRELAQQAHRGTSHVPEQRAAQEQQSFIAALADAWQRAARIAGKDEAAIERIREVFTDVADGYRARYTSTLQARSRVMSSMIAGPARFPVERNRKRMETERKRAEEAEQYLERGIKRLLRAARGPIDNSPESELERVRLNLSQREEAQEQMKAANVALRKGDDAALEDLGFTAEQIAQLKKPDFAGRTGFPDYKLTNNNAEIRRLRERLKSAEARMQDAAAGPVETERQGVKIVEDATDDRLRLIFDGKPGEAVREDLKANGFKWSPKNEAWQRQLTDNARYAAKQVLDKHYPATPNDEAGNVAMFSRAPQTESPDAWLYRYWNSRTWDSEADARDMMRRRIVEDNERYAGIFKPNDPALVDGLEFVRAPAPKSGFNKGKPQVKLKQPKAPPAPFARIGEPVDSEGGDRPRVDWESRDLNDDGTPESVLQAYGRGVGNVYRAWVNPDDIPAPKGGGIVDGYPDMRGDYDWSELQRGRGSPPPLKLRVGKNGKLVLMDGNHRLAWWREQGVSEVPAYVIDERPQAMDVPFSRTTGTPRGLSLDEAEAIVGAVREANPTAPPMIVLESVDQAPSALLKDIEDAGAANDVEAAYHEGKVYVFAPHLRSMERAMFVIAHHELRHHGMRSLAGRRLSTVLGSMVMSNPKLNAAAKAKMSDGLAKDMIQGAEEALADMDVAEIQALKGWPKLVAAVRDWLRGFAQRLRAKGHTTLADAIDPKEWTDADVAAFVARAEAVSKGGKAKFGTDGTVFAAGEDQTKSIAFQRWFGDSKVVDAAGKPLVVYHGTAADFDVFRIGDDAVGVWLSTDAGTASRYSQIVGRYKTEDGARVIPAFAAIQNPAPYDVMDALMGDARKRGIQGRGKWVREQLERKGYDGVEVDGGDAYVAFYPEQIKSAIGNNGAFDPANPDIRYSRAPRITQDTHDGAPVFASDDITIAFPQDAERFEVIPGPGERVVNYAIMPAQGFDVLGHVELLIRDGKPVSLLDIEITPTGRRQGAGRKTIETLLAANPDSDLNISNIVQDARGFWEKMGVPQQNLEQGAAYDGTLNWNTYAQAQDDTAANRAAAQGRAARGERNARAEGPGRGAAQEAQQGLTAFSRAAAPGIAQQRPTQQKVRNALNDLIGSAGAKVSWWDKTLGTQYAKAEKFPAFKRVFERVQQYLEDTSSLANEAAGQAKSILPKLETWQDLKKFGIDAKDAEAIAGPLFTGTLTDKKVYSDGELRSKFNLTDKQIGQYHEFLAAVNTSLDQAVAADVLKLLGDKSQMLRDLVITDRAMFRTGLEQYLSEQADTGDEMAAETLEMVREKYDRIDQLKAEGYAPLMRFGEYKVHIVSPDGETLYFGLYETKAAANKAARELGEDPAFAGATIERGVLSKEQYKLFSGVPLDSMEMFANAIGADKSEVFQEFLKIAKNNRSALKRLIQRKGTAGFSEDVPRVLASFVTSNARMAAGSLNLTGAKEDAQAIRDGDVQDEAIKLIDTVENPAETAGMFRGLMFMNFIGGSIASAVVNLTQPVTMTLPYLSQWGGGAKAAARLMAAGKMAASGKVDNLALRAALKRAETDGIVSPQEIHHLTAQAMGTWGTNPWLQRAAFVWAAPFSLAEQFNRRTSFIAAYNTAKAEGIEDAFGFAEKAVTETQGLYNKANAPNWSRNPIGASALTFKQFSIHYLEWMGRMYRSGPQGKRAVLLALAMLMLAAGTDGLPGADDLDDLIDTIGQALGFDTNSKKARRDFIANQLGLGDQMADVLARGLSAVPGVPLDVSLRMSMGNLMPGSGVFLRSNTDRSRDLLEVAGPAGGLIKQYMDAGQKALAGNFGDAALAATPVAIQNVSKALGMWSTGEARDTLGRRVMEADEVDGLMKFLGFNPQTIARESEKMGMIRRSEQLAKNVEGEIAGRWARAFADGDREGVADARQELADWNEANPDQRIRITSSQIMQRVKKLRQDRSQRFITSVSPERRGAVADVLQ